MSAVEAPSSASKPLMMASAPPLDPYSFVPVLEGDELKSAVEYFLSRTYLEGDPYLVSQMNTDLYLPVQVLADRISQWICPVELENVKAAIASSNEVSFDETKNLVRPNFKLSRNTIILRDLPETTEQQVRDLFADEGTFKPQEVTKEVGNCWFVSFENEANALHALSHIRKKECNGVPIRARLKQESLLRSSNVVDPSALPYYSSDYYYGMSDGQNDDSYSASNESRDGKDSRRGHRGGRGRGAFGGRKGGRDNSHSTGSSEASGRGFGGRGSRNNSGPTSSRGASSSTTSSSSGRKRVGSTKKGSTAPINLGLAHFPPLNTQDKKGHPQVIKVWTKEELVGIITALESPKTPSDLPKDCIAVVASPNITLEIISPLPKVETIDAQRNIKGPDYKAVALKSAAASSSASKPPKHNEQKKSAKASSSPVAPAEGSSSNEHPPKKNGKGEKQHDKKKGSSNPQKQPSVPSHSEGEQPSIAAASAPASAPAPLAAAVPAVPPVDPPLVASSNEGEADKISWARLVSKPNDHHSHSHDGSSESH